MGFPIGARAALIVVGIPLFLYLTFLILGATPFFQRHFLYAHKFNTLFWHDVHVPEYWGFAKNQATPFHIKTVDGESLYAWHILPLPLYAENEDNVASSREPGFVGDVTTTESFRLLKEQPDAKVILYFHGNAGHVANGWRTDTYHALTDMTPYHVIAIDYRGFGHSSGYPTEEGLIADASAVIEWVVDVAGVPASNILLFGQSLGTAVVSAVADQYAPSGTEFAGIVLVASFSDLPTMLSGYRISGYVPVLSPFWFSRPVMRWIQSFIWEKWQTAERMARVVQNTKGRLRISLVHAQDDWDIPCTESDKVFRAMANATVPTGLDDFAFASWKDMRTQKRGHRAFVTTWTAEPDIVLRHEQFSHGGHNQIMTYSPALMAVIRSFDKEQMF